MTQNSWLTSTSETYPTNEACSGVINNLFYVAGERKMGRQFHLQSHSTQVQIPGPGWLPCTTP